MARTLFAEIMKAVTAAETIEDKASVLQRHNTMPLRQLLLAALDPNVTFDTAVPSYRENEQTDGFSANSLYIEYRRIYLFMEFYKKITPQRKTALLAQILESIDTSDAIFLTKVIQKDLSEYGITKDVANKAFPGLIK